MLKELRKNEKGIVFVTVLMIIIVMMVLAVSVISMNVSQVSITEAEIKRVQSEIIAMGALARTFGNQMSSSPSNFIQYNVTVGSFTYQVTSNVYGNSGPLNTAFLDISIDLF
jgi:type II secretory pathway component PulK